VGSFYVVCSTDSAPASESLATFEGWLARTFADARVVERGNTGTHALGWMRGDQSQSWVRGWIGDDRTAVYLDGDLGLVCETALAVREVFPPGSVVVFSGDWQGIPFDLGLVPDVASLVDAIERSDNAMAWSDGTSSQ
jgi:hypothetical protein